ncbi:IDEAL domain-containing protein [Metabacillus herbersteinensis]|uniref:IDEAL domain-containing protein n=1 Tax=Metabacillus herbersteinensis TaxID=283816 RepID=A0ABV6GLN0_9BACI
MEKYLLNAPKQSEVNIIDSLFAEMFIEKAIRDFRKKEIQKEIDHSLKVRSKKEFIRLTEELKSIS